ncbi:MAG: flagellar protein FlgN [Phycisphaerales bacterium]|nr:flagellar protein FlgN [Phycisphaerales bacterium]
MRTQTGKSDDNQARPAPRSLEGLLHDLVTAHEWLLRATGAHREAMRRANPMAIATTRDEIAAATSRVAELDTERRQLVAAMAPDRPEATLSELALHLTEPQRSRSLDLAGSLRELVLQAQSEQKRLRVATEAMLRHVRGVMQQVQRGLSHAGTYGPGGRVERGAAVVTGIDMTS